MSKQSLFQEVKRFINIRAVGSTYQSRELCNYTSGIEDVTWWKSRNNNESYRTRTYQTYLKRLGFLKNVRRGVWQIVAHVPEWLDSGHANAALGYNYGKWDSVERTWSTPSYKGLTRAQIRERINYAIMAQQSTLVDTRPEVKEEIEKDLKDNTGDLATFLHNDPLTACIELRRMGVLAVPSDKNEIELHIIDKRAAAQLASWMIYNNYDLNAYPMLNDLIRPYWPKSEPEVEQEVERTTTNLVVLDYVKGKVEITQGVYEDDIEQFLEDNYGDTSAYEYMTMKTLNLQILQAY